MVTPSDVTALNASIVRLDKTVNELARAVERAVPRNVFRRYLVWLVAGVAVALAALLLMGRVASETAQARIRADVTICFLNAGRASPPVIGYCDARFAGYAEMQERSAANTARFEGLLGDVAELKRRVAELEADFG